MESDSFARKAATFFRIDQASPAVSPRHTDAHNFQPVHDSKIVAVNKFVEGAVRRFLAYDCDPGGNEIRLYYTDDLDSPWAAYSGNPILGKKPLSRQRTHDGILDTLFGHAANPQPPHRFRWPSVVWDGSALHMFLANHTQRRIERWESSGGINFSFQEIIQIENPTGFMNPFCWQNPNDLNWYLFHKQQGRPRILLARKHHDIRQVSTAGDTIVLSDADTGEGTVAAPAICYYRDRYWLTTQGSAADLSKIYSFSSTDPDSGFRMTLDSPILISNEISALPMVSPDESKLYFYTTRKLSRNRWAAEIREASIPQTPEAPFLEPLPAVPHIDICVATYKRPQLLRKLLHSLAALETDKEITYGIIVIDNDVQRSAEHVVSEFREKGIPLIYDIEPRQNIALARNRALQHASGDLFATIDDDEFVDSRWLIHLYRAIREYDAAAALGPVNRLFPEHTPEFVKQSISYDFPNPETGTVRNFVHSTRSSLIRRDVIAEMDGPFDMEFGLTGGEDSVFFERLKQERYPIIWCREAIAFETIPPHKTTLSWLIRHRFRNGHVGHLMLRKALVNKDAPSLSQMTRICLKRLIISIGGTGVYLLKSVGRQDHKIKAVAHLQNISHALGFLLSFFNFRYETYK